MNNQKFIEEKMLKLTNETNEILNKCYEGDTDGETYLKVRMIHIVLSDWIHHMNMKHVPENMQEIANNLCETIRKKDIKHYRGGKCLN